MRNGTASSSKLLPNAKEKVGTMASTEAAARERNKAEAAQAETGSEAKVTTASQPHGPGRPRGRGTVSEAGSNRAEARAGGNGRQNSTSKDGARG